MKQQQIEQIRQACLEVNPEKVTLQNFLTEIPIGLEDILMAINKNGLPDEYLFCNVNWMGNIEISGAFGRKFCAWKLTKPLQDQSDECIEFISKLLK